MTAVFLKGTATALLLPDESVHCIVTSPPYNCGIEYLGYMDEMPWYEYMQCLVRPAVDEMFRVLVPGGRVWINAPVNGPPMLSGTRMNVANLWSKALSGGGFWYRDTVIWKQDAHDGGTQWGSWLAPSAPNLRGEYEVVLCFFKETWKRERPAHCSSKKLPRHELGGDWTDLCRNIWSIPPAKTKFSPAPFPLELPARCIRLSTWPGEVVLDPFGGGGTTAEAADILGRVGISVDVSEKQTLIAKNRLTTLFGG